MKFAMVFPGQGSQFAGMARAFGAHSAVADALTEASDAISVDLKRMAEGDDSAGDLNRTENTQPAMLAMDVGIFRAFSAATGGASPVVLAGHSLGEYAALVCAGAVDFCDAVRVAKFRGEAMARATPPGTGGISAVIGLSPEEVEGACAEMRKDGAKVWAANYNSPAQVVIAGEAGSVAKASEVLKGRGAKKVAALPMSAPSHCPLMGGAADELAGFLKGIAFKRPGVPVLHNMTAAELEGGEAALRGTHSQAALGNDRVEEGGEAELRGTHSQAELGNDSRGAALGNDKGGDRVGDDIRTLLREQVVCPVRWIETIQIVAGRVARVLECGPGKALTGLGKRIAPEVEHLALSDSESLARVAEEVLESRSAEEGLK